MALRLMQTTHGITAQNTIGRKITDFADEAFTCSESVAVQKGARPTMLRTIDRRDNGAGPPRGSRRSSSKYGSVS
jgi:hypothetical protein